MFGKTSQNFAYMILLALIATTGFGAWFGGWGSVDLAGLGAF
ncbi:hypothetical protein [Abyssibius alkaniclasticus]|nr:hypothetical protein [Abyssibius alkaniclasticus]